MLIEQARESGKPENIIEKMVEGRMRKFYEENALLDQTFVVDGESRVGDVLDKLGTVKVGYAHNVNSSTKVGAEVVRKLATGDTSVTLGYSKALTSGALAKLKVDNMGILTALYETKLTTGEKIGGSFQLQATDLSKPVKYGFAVDLS